MKTLLLIPTPAEAAPIRAALPEARIAICGVGMADAAAAAASAILDRRPGRILLAGIAGAYGEQPAVGEVVAVGSERIASLPPRYRTLYRADWRLGSLAEVAGNTVTRTGEGTPQDAAIENMEGAAVMAVCRRLNVPCAEIRAISNRVGAPIEEWRIDEALEALATRLRTLFEEEDE